MNIEELAKLLHYTHYAIEDYEVILPGHKPLSWEDEAEHNRDDYRYHAARMLQLMEATMRPEPLAALPDARDFYWATEKHKAERDEARALVRRLQALRSMPGHAGMFRGDDDIDETIARWDAEKNDKVLLLNPKDYEQDE